MIDISITYSYYSGYFSELNNRSAKPSSAIINMSIHIILVICFPENMPTVSYNAKCFFNSQCFIFLK